MAIYTVSISSAGSSDVVSVADGSTYATLEVSAGRGPKGDGWTGVSYDSNTGRFTFTSNDGLGYVSDDITVDLDAAVAAAQAAQSGAEGAEAATEALFDQFGDQYLGPKASDPTVDNDGDPLTAGDIYFNTTDSVLKFYSGSDWVAPESIATTAASDAQAAQAAAETAETNAETAQTAAETAQTGAETAETNAAASETAAASSAAAASTSADEAAASAASIDTDNIDINGGTIDGTVIGGTTPAAGNFTTGSFTGNATFGDNDKAIFGAGSDLQIYHDGSHSYVIDEGTGSLRLRGVDIQMQNTAGVNAAKFISGADVQLFHAGSQKLATTSTGVDVTGTVTADGLTVAAGTVTFGGEGVSSAYINSPESMFFNVDSNNTPEDSFFQFGQGRTGGSGGKTFLNIAGNGDISFYEDTGTTPKFFWDASAESLGIGTSSPSYTADIQSGSTATPALRAKALSGTAAGTAIFDAVGGGGDIRLRIQNDGNVGIGTSSPTGRLDITSSAGEQLRVINTGTGSSAALFQNSTSGTGSGNGLYLGVSAGINYLWTYENQPLVLATNNLERMRIDSSGNLLVGTTTVNGEGISIRGGVNNYIYASRGQAPSVYLDRLISDGDIMQFRKDGATVGSIGTTSARNFAFYSPSEGGLETAAVGILPMMSGVRSDNQTDLGFSGSRFKDLYLSGGVYLGGTGAANKLDDYEEGTWTPTYTASGGGTYNLIQGSGRYTKIGNVVTVTWWSQFASPTGTLSGDFQMTGLPFTSNGSTRASAAFRTYGWNSGSSIVQSYTSGGTNINWQYYTTGMSGAAINVPANWVNSHGDELGGTLTYQIS